MSNMECPRCLGPVPNKDHVGEYPGALSRTDNQTEICSDCGTAEGWEQFVGKLLPQSRWAKSLV